MKAINARPPVKGVHNDYTETSAPRRLREIAGDAEAERRFKKRWAIIQVWRPIRGTVMIDPLGICDGRSIPQTGFILVQRRYKDRTGEVYHIAYNPAHEWFYFPQMKRHEALVFKVFDTDPERGDALHRAFGVRRSQHAAERAAAREHRDADVRVRWRYEVAAIDGRVNATSQLDGGRSRNRYVWKAGVSDRSMSVILDAPPSRRMTIENLQRRRVVRERGDVGVGRAGDRRAHRGVGAGARIVAV